MQQSPPHPRRPVDAGTVETKENLCHMTEWDLIVRLLVAAVLSGLIGLEREIRDQAAGFRTHILVGSGAAAFAIASAYGFDAWVTSGPTNVSIDPSRLAAQVVSGIGFLGAGAIIRHGFSIRGLTTAASLWAVAAVGVAAGIGMFLLAAATTLVVLISLYGLRAIESRVILPRTHNVIDVHLTFRHHDFGPLSAVVDYLDQNHIAIRHMSIDPAERGENAIHLMLELPAGMNRAEVMAGLTALPDVAGITLE